MKRPQSNRLAALMTGAAFGSLTLLGSGALAQQPLVPPAAPQANPAPPQAPAPGQPAANAQASGTPATPAPLTPAPQAAASQMARLELASVVIRGETVTDGDYVTSSRYYGDWRLVCDAVESRNRRICRLEQDLGLNGQWAMTWKLVESSQKKPFFLASFPAAANPAKKFQMVIGGFVREFGREEWSCTDKTCEIYIPADTTAQQLILGASNIRFRYTLDNQPIELSGSLKGFMTALDTLVDEPPAAQAPATPVASSKPARPSESRKVASRQFETIRRSNDPMPEHLKKIYGVN